MKQLHFLVISKFNTEFTDISSYNVQSSLVKPTKYHWAIKNYQSVCHQTLLLYLLRSVFSSNTCVLPGITMAPYCVLFLLLVLLDNYLNTIWTPLYPVKLS